MVVSGRRAITDNRPAEALLGVLVQRADKEVVFMVVQDLAMADVAIDVLQRSAPAPRQVPQPQVPPTELRCGPSARRPSTRRPARSQEVTAFSRCRCLAAVRPEGRRVITAAALQTGDAGEERRLSEPNVIAVVRNLPISRPSRTIDLSLWLVNAEGPGLLTLPRSGMGSLHP